MSRLDLSPRPDLPFAVEITCGWDGPLQTFFLQVEAIEPADPDDALLLWIGTDWREVTDPAEILTAAAPWAVVSDDLAAELAADQAADQRANLPPILAALRRPRD